MQQSRKPMMLLTTLMLSLDIAMTQEIRLENMDNGPGLLPFNIGLTDIITHYHTFLHFIDLDEIGLKIETLKTQIHDIEGYFDNHSLPISKARLQHLTEKLDKASLLLSTLKPGRVKRGLINGLGSIIKSVTGNLDYSDAIKYDEAIKILQNNQNNIISEFNNHISLSKAWMSEHAKIIDKLVENQIDLNKTMYFMISKFNTEHVDTVVFAEISQLLNSFDDNINELLLVIRNIEDSLAFTRTYTAHHIMLDISMLRSMLGTLSSVYKPEQLLDLELREYYSVIRTGSYFSNNRIVIVLRFPIISPNTFTLFKLSILPNHYQHIIIPPFPYIATNNDNYVYIEAECPKSRNRFLCEETLNHHIKRSPDCIADLVISQQVSNSCIPTTLTLAKPAMEKLDDQHYCVTFPSLTKISLSCKRREYLNLQGSYLVTVPPNCSLHTKDLTIVNINNQLKGEPLKILLPMNSTPTTPQRSLKIHTIDLNGLHNLEKQIEVQMPIIPENPTIIYHTTLPFYVMLLCSAIFVIYIGYRRLHKSTQNAGVQEQQVHPEGDPAATFSLNVLK
ncbi:uncharacterized protein LOC123689348 [Pieris rapae]|uniref:uncharacterized protein LOC123689348 n=1 Tax=Pieris rapae TaxID=64459 RepID=UPI001E27CCE0|nr:uncharacterized protein LOC123689348 [Pieris rapae]